MQRTILLSLSDVLLVDYDAKTETETKKLRFGRVRLFALSLTLGLLLGTMLCVLQPARSMDASLRTRAFVRCLWTKMADTAGTIAKAR